METERIPRPEDEPDTGSDETSTEEEGDISTTTPEEDEPEPALPSG